MFSAFKYLTSLLFVAVVVQVGLAGYGAFNAIHKADKDHTITKKQIENGFDPHGLVGSLVGLLIILLVIAAAAGRLGQPWIKWTLGLLVLGVLQFVFAAVSTSTPAVGFLHGINALAIYAAAGLLAHRAWTSGRGEAVAA